MPDRREMHWVMTVQGPTPGRGTAVLDAEGTVELADITTRRQVYYDVRAQVLADFRRETGAQRDPNVIFWSLEPNDLTYRGE